MVGRAGRPQFDTEGVAVIMTQQSTVGQYQVSGVKMPVVLVLCLSALPACR
jgi:replicative superfamily II helicase